MTSVKCVYWQDNDMWLGYMEEFPDYMTQGESLGELQANLASIYEELTDQMIFGSRMSATLRERAPKLN